MKGGHFDYKEFVLTDIAEQIADLVINNNTPDEWGYTNDFSDKTIQRFRETVDVLLKAVSMVRRIDYLVSRDEKEETFHEKWDSEFTTHHPACDCREEKMLLICRQLLKNEHNELKRQDLVRLKCAIALHVKQQ